MQNNCFGGWGWVCSNGTRKLYFIIYLMVFFLILLPIPHTAIQNRNPVWYQALTHGLNEEQRKQLQDIATLADQRRAAHGMSVCHTL